MITLPRIGIGYDSHKLASGLACKLGGVVFDSPVGPVGHSDADAVLHAVCDALLGAAGLNDLGTTFPDSDPQWHNADSRKFVHATMAKLKKLRLTVCSCDIVVICDQPKIGPMREAIRAQLSELLNVSPDRVNIKGKTTEGGDSSRIEVTAVTLLVTGISR